MSTDITRDFIGLGVGNNAVMFVHLDDLATMKDQMRQEMRDNAQYDMEGFMIIPPTRKVMCRCVCDFCDKKYTDENPIFLHFVSDRDRDHHIGWYSCKDCENHLNASRAMDTKLRQIFDFAKVFGVATDVKFFRQRINGIQDATINGSILIGGQHVLLEFNDALRNEKSYRYARISNILHSTFGENIPAIRNEFIEKFLEECAPLVAEDVKFYIAQLRDEYEMACDGTPVLE